MNTTCSVRFSERQDGSAPHCDVVVIGAGLSGLVAADALTRAGLTVLVYEGREEVGGLIRTSKRDGLDLGASEFSPREESLAGLLEEFAIETYPASSEGDAIFEDDRGRLQRFDGNPFSVLARRPVGGFGRLVDGLVERLSCGSLRTSDMVQAVTLEQEGITVEAVSGAVHATAAIMAVAPGEALSSVSFNPQLAPELLAMAGPVGGPGQIHAVGLYPGTFWRTMELAGTAKSSSGPFSLIEDFSGPGSHPAALHAYADVAAFHGQDPDTVEEVFRTQMGRIFGPQATAPDRIVIAHWNSSQQHWQSPATHSKPAADSAGFRGDLHERRLIWASAHTAAEGYGRLEGAVRSGKRAARQAFGLVREQGSGSG